MSQPNNGNEGGSQHSTFAGFPSIMGDVPPNASAAGLKGNALNSSYMNYSGNTNRITDMQSISYSRDLTQASSMRNSTSALRITSPGCFDGGMFTHVPAPPTAMLRRTIDSIDQLAASGVQRFDNSLSFSASASYVPVGTQQWGCVPPPSSGPEGTQSAAPCVYTKIPPNGVLVRMMDPAGNAVWHIQSDGNTIPPPPPPPLPHQPQQRPQLQSQQQPAVAIASPTQTSVRESPGSSFVPAPATAATTVAPPPFKVSPLAWNLQAPLGVAGGAGDASPDTQPSRSTTSPRTEGDADDYEYEPYNSNTLANRRVGSLDRVRCKVHGKERSAQNMVMVRSKATNEIHWRCKRSSQCKVRTIDCDDAALNSNENALRNNGAESLMSPTPDQVPAVSLNQFFPNASVPWSRRPPAPPQYSLVSPNNGALPMNASFQSMSQSVHAYTPDYVPSAAQVVTLPSAFSQNHPPYAANTIYYPVYAQENAQQPPPPPPPQPPQQQSGFVTVNGVPYRLVHVEAPSTHMR
ncbi:hypothetical protein ABB37_07641 [Leptomonas pyrrhocoris]|uniref:Uncharacterized protein n=1 Tax=Leptomonas pyrrhocoris TaxID=157538 RepID=A0A0N0DT25_LEPPY|nr:hypothetical protein ABB37_07641 [Leptomonas pyrrhocoris]XP_015655280.1 hypothetical protein ABB37_07641 [Leptomonas pyrrhocoris]KPA76840.1 hypothetical protein ABB37_07641 [Leptomonas pyrrhocoris]KPA76841.1 hypothetical protein ABB37_07641 [Leptomonas pyrrhocoris]|eukprot:XP_015655279.1 hypothetical protein ABB37_07641 [Leptomonas pyrrhocoris]